MNGRISDLQNLTSRPSLLFEANGVQLQVSTIKHSEKKETGLGVFAACDILEGVLMVTPLHLAITPMSVLQDPEFGKAYAKLFEDGDVDDRLLMMLFLMVEHIRGSSSLWAPYLDVLPTSFGTPLWFTEEELQELQGTALHNATKIQLRNLGALFEDKVKPFAEQVLSSVGALEREIDFKDFLWANCIFWTRALNIPCPHPFVFPKQVHSSNNGDSQGKVMGLVPGIDFCNHDPKGVVKWEVDGPEGAMTGVPNSMYLKTDSPFSANDEVLISYGNKGNEELLFLYGFVIEDNADDFYMVHFPKEALDHDPFGEVKVQLLQEQNLTLRWLLPSTLLQKGFYSSERRDASDAISAGNQECQSSFSWSGVRKPPSFLNQCVFPEETLAALRVVAMKENEVQAVISMLEELSQSRLQEAPMGENMRVAVWEVCGNSSALQLLTDLIAARLLELEEGTGTETADQEILSSVYEEPHSSSAISKNMESCIVYRKRQKYLAKQFLKESEHLLELSISEDVDRRKLRRV
ncbi:hypothetical protein GOP47_0029778 [Adiantum capillus-veneris]|nr:hypothetical protein GOP47_0029778 [Adiantum capillus-veneris]